MTSVSVRPSDTSVVVEAGAVCAVSPCRALPEVVIWASHDEESLDLCGPHYLDMVREALQHSRSGRLLAFPSVTAWVPSQRRT